MDPLVKAQIGELLGNVGDFASEAPVQAAWDLSDAIDLLMQEVERQGREIAALKAQLSADA